MSETIFYKSSSSTDAKLIIYNREGVISVENINLNTIIGRSDKPGDCNIVLDSKIVSRVHGQFYRIENQYYYKDLDSSNGTYINNTLIGKNVSDNHSPVLLNDSDVISINSKSGKENHEDAIFMIFTFNADLMFDRQIELNDEIAEISIGRDNRSTMNIDDPCVSEKHASFFNSSYGWTIIDHNSTNGVYINNRKITIPEQLVCGDTVKICGHIFIYLKDRILISISQVEQNLSQKNDTHFCFAPEIPSVNTQNTTSEQYSYKQNHVYDIKRLDINIVERSVFARFKKFTLLQDINLSVSSGDMILILGGSGAGKTTFINAVMGYEKANGKIVYNGTDIYEEYDRMKYEIGFVPQQDLLRGNDSVYNTLSNAAQMKLPSSYSEEKRENKINEVLNLFGLEREKHSLVVKLSGGQRKRLSIAVEFISDPALFFLDEPDSGIDDIMGRGIMEKLREIADMGKIVMVITHSPQRAADLFDKVIVLAKSTIDNCGHLAFFGTKEDAFKFFDAESFRDIVKKINRPDENGDGLSDYYIEKYKSIKI